MAEGRIQRHHLPAMWWLNLSNGDRADMMDAFERSRDIGFTLLSAVDHFAIEGSGKKFLKKIRI